jgi:hypothetical protein
MTSAAARRELRQAAGAVAPSRFERHDELNVGDLLQLWNFGTRPPETEKCVAFCVYAIHARDGIDLKKSNVFEIECEIGDHTATQIAIFADARGQQGVGFSAALNAQ